MDLYECDAAKFLVVDEKRLRPPFVAISGLGAAAANDLMSLPDRRTPLHLGGGAVPGLPQGEPGAHRQLRATGALGDMPRGEPDDLF